MCGRFQLSVKGKHIKERFNLEVFDELYKPNYNCAPSQKLPVITNAEPNKMNFYKWGLIPFWAKDPKSKYQEVIQSKENHERDAMSDENLVPIIAVGFILPLYCICSYI